jgi:meiotically up-regulated gene 157 (Mug157) protein
MSATSIRYKGKVINHDPMTNPENGYVKGFYFQDLDNDVVKHYIFNCPMTWEVDPSTVKVCRHKDLEEYFNPVTTHSDIKELQEKLVQACIDFIKERNLTDIDEVSFSVDGLEKNAINCGQWVPAMDSCISIVGLQKDDDVNWRARKLIGENM